MILSIMLYVLFVCNTVYHHETQLNKEYTLMTTVFEFSKAKGKGVFFFFFFVFFFCFFFLFFCFFFFD